MRIIELQYKSGIKVILNASLIIMIDVRAKNRIGFILNDMEMFIRVPLHSVDKIYDEIRHFVISHSDIDSYIIIEE